jgi:hypothetical protein
MIQRIVHHPHPSLCPDTGCFRLLTQIDLIPYKEEAVGSSPFTPT